MKQIQGGVCAAKGFTANGIRCGIRKNKTKRDISLIYSDVVGSATAVYTKNLVKGAPLTVTKNNIADGRAQAMICNSGNANTCNANGIEIAEQTCELLATELGISAKDVIVASTGVIGQPLDITPIANGMSELVKGLGNNCDLACEGIMTTDTKKKEGRKKISCIHHLISCPHRTNTFITKYLSFPTYPHHHLHSSVLLH